MRLYLGVGTTSTSTMMSFPPRQTPRLLTMLRILAFFGKRYRLDVFDHFYPQEMVNIERDNRNVFVEKFDGRVRYGNVPFKAEALSDDELTVFETEIKPQSMLPVEPGGEV